MAITWRRRIALRRNFSRWYNPPNPLLSCPEKPIQYTGSSMTPSYTLSVLKDYRMRPTQGYNPQGREYISKIEENEHNINVMSKYWKFCPPLVPDMGEDAIPEVASQFSFVLKGLCKQQDHTGIAKTASKIASNILQEVGLDARASEYLSRQKPFNGFNGFNWFNRFRGIVISTHWSNLSTDAFIFIRPKTPISIWPI